MYFALYSGNKEAAVQIAKKAVQNRILSQIKPDGSMPEELARARPLFYSNYNLSHYFHQAFRSLLRQPPNSPNQILVVNQWHVGIPRLLAGTGALLGSGLQKLTQSFLKQAPCRSETRIPILEML